MSAVQVIAAGAKPKRITCRNLSYNNAGDLFEITYDDGVTAPITHGYDRLGCQNSILCNGTTSTPTYNLAGEVLSESYSGGTLAGLSILSGRDKAQRVEGSGDGILPRKLQPNSVLVCFIQTGLFTSAIFNGLRHQHCASSIPTWH